jgi:hypothetical protein
VNAFGGAGGFGFLWSSSAASQTTATATNLNAQVHRVTVTDANACTASTSVSVTQPSAFSNPQFNTTLISCNGLTDGTATVSVLGATPAYTFSWDNGQTTQTATGFASGPHSVTITDANGCSISATTIITEPSAITVTLDADSVNCFGGTDGRITALVIGGASPYSFNWSNGSNLPINQNLSIGNYAVTVTDNAGCSVVRNASIGQPSSAISANIINFTNSSPLESYITATSSISPLSLYLHYHLMLHNSTIPHLIILQDGLLMNLLFILNFKNKILF